jgi:hypothetical protein
VRKHDRRNEPPCADLMPRVRGDFREMPCPRFTPDEVVRLLGLPLDFCVRVLDELPLSNRMRTTPGLRRTHAASVG